jgi:hypothetical protein
LAGCRQSRIPRLDTQATMLQTEQHVSAAE